jgi:uncharacterized damage-inducible protein DinB
MATSNPIDIMLAHDPWATRQILDACAKLTPEQFHQPFDMGPGSLHATTTHILAAIRRWTDVLHQVPMRPDFEGPSRTPADLLAALDEVYEAYTTVARAHPLDGLVERTRGGKTYQFPRGVVLTHVATHSMHHRAQCLNMLRHLGVQPLPPSSVIEWQVAVQPQD